MDQRGLYGPNMGLSGYGAGRAVYLSFSSYYHSMILSLEGVVDTQDSVEIMRLLGRHTRPEIEITTQRKRLLGRHTRPEIEITTQRNC